LATVAAVNLLGGLIKADAITAHARSQAVGDKLGAYGTRHSCTWWCRQAIM